MKNMKKILALLVAVLMIAASVSAFAAPADVTLKVTGPVEGHQYSYFQLLKGDLNTAKDKLSNVVWGKDAAASITYGDKTVEPVEDTEVPEDFLTYLSGLTGEKTIADTVIGMVKGTGTAIPADGVTVKTGYYVIKDAYTNADGDGKETTTLSTNIVRIVESTEITPKASTTEHKKEVLDINDTTDVALDLSGLMNVDASKWSSSADYDFGDKVPFKLTTKIADDFEKYTNYYLSVNDTLKNGLVLDQDSIKVYVDGQLANEGTAEGEYSVTKDAKSFKVEFTKLNGNANAKPGKNVVVIYTATLDAETAVIGGTGNINESYAEFSNNPNGDQSGKGTTPKDTAVVFTMKTTVTKIDGDKDERTTLNGAAFKLEKKFQDGTTKLVKEYTVVDGQVSFEFKGLDDGVYVLTETVTPDGYNTIDPITFKIVAEHSETGITSLDVVKEDGSTFTGEITFTKVAANGTIDTDVVNKSGTTLPSTGGMGTTILYIGGSILVILAAVLLITKRRMNAND